MSDSVERGKTTRVVVLRDMSPGAVEVQPVTHANGAKSCIARALDGGDEPDDFWYEQAEKVLDELTRKGFVVLPTELWNPGRNPHGSAVVMEGWKP